MSRFNEAAQSIVSPQPAAVQTSPAALPQTEEELRFTPRGEIPAAAELHTEPLRQLCLLWLTLTRHFYSGL